MSVFRAHKKRGDVSMCKKIHEVNSLTPEIVLQKFWDKTIPVDVKHILQNVGILCRENDFSKLESALHINKGDAILGLALSHGDDLGILFSPRMDQASINYVLAHELAHCVLHLEPSEEYHVELKMSKDLYSSNKRKSVVSRYLNSHKELQADRFAADILIPTDALLEYLKKEKHVDIVGISKHFQVSKEIVRLKVMNLR